MKRLGIFTASAALTIFLTACGQDEIPTEAQPPEPIEVQLIVPEHAEAGEAVTVSALVTQGEEKVEDASEVEYEIWEEGKKEDSIHIPSNNEKQGVYTAETTFETDGLYNVQVHVTAREMHVMPTQQITVGSAAENHEHHENHEAADGFTLHFMQPGDVSAQDETALVSHLQMNGEALAAVKVRYEVKQPDGTVNWVDTVETKPGEYSGKYTFTENGSYEVTIHAENEELHEHEQHTIEVK